MSISYPLYCWVPIFVDFVGTGGTTNSNVRQITNFLEVYIQTSSNHEINYPQKCKFFSINKNK